MWEGRKVKTNVYKKLLNCFTQIGNYFVEYSDYYDIQEKKKVRFHQIKKTVIHSLNSVMVTKYLHNINLSMIQSFIMPSKDIMAVTDLNKYKKIILQKKYKKI